MGINRATFVNETVAAKKWNWRLKKQAETYLLQQEMLTCRERSKAAPTSLSSVANLRTGTQLTTSGQQSLEVHTRIAVD